MTLKELNNLATKAKIAPDDLRLVICTAGDTTDLPIVHEAQIVISSLEDSNIDIILHID